MQQTVNLPIAGSNPASPVNPKSIGEHSEAMVLAKFLHKGWVVLMPFGDNQRYDFVIDRGNGFERIQVKTGKFKSGIVHIHTCSSQYHRGKKRKGYIGECDYFVSYVPIIDKFYMIPVNYCPDSKITLRINPTKNNQKLGVQWASEYEI